MKYTVVHSKDPYLLARLATDLQMNAKTDCLDVDRDPFDIEFQWLTCYSFGFKFYNHQCLGNPTRHELTASNYIKVLTQILEP